MPETATLRVLHLEDDPLDRELVAATLLDGGLTCEIVAVETRETFSAELDHGAFDVILSDDSLPTFDGRTAQAIARRLVPHIPFIVVSGTLGEEVAIERLKDGATDCVLKQRLSRLVPAIARAIREAQVAVEHARAEAELHRLNCELADAKSFIENLIAASPSMIFRIDPDDFRITYASPNLAWLLGYETAEVVGVRNFWRRLIHPDDLERAAGHMRNALLACAVQIEEEYRLGTKDGRFRWFFSVMRFEYDTRRRPIAILWCCGDITEQQRAEAAVVQAREEAEGANRAKSEFLSRMSHDLRTPLNAVLGFAQLLSAESLTDPELECVQQILKGGRHLLDLINEVLDITRIETGRLSLSPEPVDVRDIVKHTVALVAPLAAPRGITLAVEARSDAERSVLADRQRLRQVLLNLLSNAVKYNRAGGRVTVGFERRPEGRVRINVTDTGAGIPPEKLQLLFRPFERLGAETTAIEGTGLGLTLSRGLAEAMGGTLGVTSDIDRGSTFYVELAATDAPLVVEDTKSPVSSFETVATIGPAAVLYIDNNASNVRLMHRLLGSRPGVALLHAADGQTGLKMALERRPNAILLDLHLPDMPGEEVLRQLWEERGLRRTPVIVVSADATPAQMRRLLASGAAAYLTKPLDLGAVLQALDRALLPPEEPRRVRS